MSESSESHRCQLFFLCLARKELLLWGGWFAGGVGALCALQYWKEPLGGSQGQILESLNPKEEGMDGLYTRKIPFLFFFFFFQLKDDTGTSLVKLLDHAPSSAGKDSSFPFSLDKGQAWEAPTVCV